MKFSPMLKKEGKSLLQPELEKFAIFIIIKWVVWAEYISWDKNYEVYMAHMDGERWNVSLTWDLFFRFIHVENAQQGMSAPRWKTNTLEAEMLSLGDGENFEHERYYNMEQRAQNLCTKHIAHRECACRYDE